MAGRPMGRLHQDDVRFYVYALRHGDQVCYVGKGSGNRFEQQKLAYGLDGEIIERFSNETKAYEAERKHIGRLNPHLNILPGGNGSRAIPRRQPRLTKWEREIQAIGTKAYCARLLLGCERSRPGILDVAIIPTIALIATGEQCLS